MKTVSALATLLGFSLVGGTAFAQLATLPQSSSVDGITPVSEVNSGNSGASHWDAPTGIKQYNYDADGNVPLPATFTSAVPVGLTAAWATVQTGGGDIRAIYTGETAGWQNAFGYTYDKSPATDPANSYTVWKNIEGTTGVAESTNPVFGDSIDVTFIPNDSLATNFDFWLNAGTGTSFGGVDTVLNPANSAPVQDHVKWLESPILLNTWVPSAGKYEDVATYVFALEDWKLNAAGNDYDYSDLLVSVQLFDINGTPLGGSPVPEASTYGLVGAAGLLGLAALRRRKAAQAKA